MLWNHWASGQAFTLPGTKAQLLLFFLLKLLSHHSGLACQHHCFHQSLPHEWQSESFIFICLVESCFLRLSSLLHVHGLQVFSLSGFVFLTFYKLKMSLKKDAGIRVKISQPLQFCNGGVFIFPLLSLPLNCLFSSIIYIAAVFSRGCWHTSILLFFFQVRREWYLLAFH